MNTYTTAGRYETNKTSWNGMAIISKGRYPLRVCYDLNSRRCTNCEPFVTTRVFVMMS